jgi:3',5'-cyclic AMP phosphodiesterase CpdA
MPWILHASDPHLGDVGAVSLDDEKEDFEQADLETTQRVFKRTLMGLRSYVDQHGRPDVAVISGDLTYRTHPSGFDAFGQLLDHAAEVLPADRSNIVVVPGNHDVLWPAEPGTAPRYAGFLSCTRDLGCTTPLIDGVDFDRETGELWPAHVDSPHVAITSEILVVPINSSNWCGTIVRPRNAMTLDDWRTALDPTGGERDRLLAEVERLQRRDMARISRHQIEALGQCLHEAGVPRVRTDDPRVRVAVLHHQLLPVSMREERKAFESLINLGLVRATLAEYGFDLVLHGHKHESGMYWDLAGGPSDDLNRPRARMLVVSSPGHFDVNDPVMRAIEIDGPAAAPGARVVTFLGAGPQRRHTAYDDGQRIPLWAADVDRRKQTTIHAGSAHECYARLRSIYALRGGDELRNVVCQIEDPADANGLPPDYPAVGVDDPHAWFTALVDWWQLDRSELVARGLIGFNHGERIYRRWGNQVERAIRILNDRHDSSRALVQLVAPRETGRYKMDDRDLYRGSFPAFVLAEFSVAERDNARHLDCFGYFRKQEMQFWWPVNLAELARLQERVREKLRPRARTGRIVTFSAVALWKEALPRVAVPLVDLWVEDRSRLLAMAVAAAFPAEAAGDAVRDWREVLRDLAGTARDAPPKVSAGVRVLLDDVRAITAAATDPGLGAIVEQLEDLDAAYAAHAETEELPVGAHPDVRRRVGRLTDALVAVLPEAAP